MTRLRAVTLLAVGVLLFVACGVVTLAAPAPWRFRCNGFTCIRYYPATATPTDFQRICAGPTPAATDVVGRAVRDACAQVTPAAGR